MADPIKGFISYSHKDQWLLNEFKSHLAALEKPGLACFWTDHMIDAGGNWEEALLEQLQTAHIILLLISSDFIASGYINTVEVKEALARSNNGKARVIPVILRSVLWETMPFSKLQALPTLGRPVNDTASWGSRDEAFLDVVRGIGQVIGELMEQPSVYEPAKEQLLSESTLHTALLSLDYKEQVKTFRQVIERKPHTGAFLIYGELDHGQIWLLHRLINNAAIRNVDKPMFRFPLRRRACGVTLDNLWYSLGKWVNMRHPPKSPLEIAEQVYELWKKQSIILILDDLDRVNESYLQMFLKEFWEPLMNVIEKNGGEMLAHYLLLFLIDNEGRVDRWRIPWSEELDEPYVPVKLRKIRSFTQRDINDWIDNEVNRLPSKLTVEGILSTGSIPGNVLQQICELCGHNWYDRESEWLEKYGNIR